MEESRQNIKCPVFMETDVVIKNIISKYLKANSKERQYFAQDILLETKTLLSCANYDAKNTNCLNCHSIAHQYFLEYESLSQNSQRRFILEMIRKASVQEKRYFDSKFRENY